jgi:predicted PurR-regulated permease PerM
MNSARLLIVFGLIVAAGVLIYLLSPILTPFLLSILLAYIGNPMVTRLHGLGVPRTITTILLFFILLLLLLALVLVLIPLIQKQLATFAAKLPGYIDWVEQQVSRWGDGAIALEMETIRQQVLDQWQNIGRWFGRVVSLATTSGMRVVGWLLNLFLVPVVTFYLLRDWEDILARIKRSLPHGARDRVVPLAREMDDALAAFLRGQLMVMIGLGTIYSVGLWIVGLDLALPIGLLAGLVSFIPYLGFIVGILVAGIAALLQFQDWVPLLWVLAVFTIGQVLESTVLTPRLVGERIGLHPVVVIFAVMAGGQLFGFLGVLLALPVAAMGVVALRHWYNEQDASSSSP